MYPREAIKRIEKLGGRLVRVRGSHHTYAATTAFGQTVQTTVSLHKKEIRVGTLHGIQKDLEAAFGKGWLI